jgi:hypothetical protein
MTAIIRRLARVDRNGFWNNNLATQAVDRYPRLDKNPARCLWAWDHHIQTAYHTASQDKPVEQRAFEVEVAVVLLELHHIHQLPIEEVVAPGVD